MTSLERGPDGGMTSCALLIDSLRLGGNQASTSQLVHRMTTGAADAAPGMAALDTPHLSWFITMAGETRFVRARDRKFAGLVISTTDAVSMWALPGPWHPSHA